MNQTLLDRYNAKFQDIISGLNEEQLAAVNKIDGPVMVVAGPGLVKRRYWRLGLVKYSRYRCPPDEILCLTYTDAGAVAMRKRMFEFIVGMLTGSAFIPFTLL